MQGQKVDDEADPLSEGLETTSMLRLPPAHTPPAAPFQAVVFGSDLVRACPLKTIQALTGKSVPSRFNSEARVRNECRKH